MPRSSALAAVAFLALLATQDPQKDDDPTRPKPPAGAKPLPPVQEPFRTEVERQDLLQEFGGRSPLAGFYELRGFAQAGTVPVRAQGYLVIGRQHLSIHLQAAAGEIPALQTGFRRYQVIGDRLHTTTLLGLRNTPDGDVLLDKAGATQTCGYRLVGTRLTLVLEGGRVLEFERIE